MAIVMNNLGYLEYPQRGPMGSYFIWKGKAKEEEIPKAKMLFNSKENKDGSLLKIMFGTQTVMEGVDFKNVRQVHILDPWWNDSRIQQVIARAIRLCSHRDLPPAQRIVDVFIHLSTLGSAETLYELKIKKSVGDSKIRSLLKLENPDETDSSKWVFRESNIKIDKDNQITISDIQKTFLASSIISGSIRKLADPSLTKTFGSYKNLDTISVQQYMYQTALRKLNINRQFENAIKEVAIDCTINKYGNIIRLNEFYKPSEFYNIYNLEYENYSNGEKYVREGPTQFSLEEILDNSTKNMDSYNFKNTVTNVEIKLNKSLLLLENIDCKILNYNFENLPPKIVDLTLNKELIPQLMKLPLKKIRQYFYDVQTSLIKPRDPDLNKKLNTFLSKDSLVQKQEIISKFLEMGIGEESVWQLYPLEQLKREYSLFKFKK